MREGGEDPYGDEEVSAPVDNVLKRMEDVEAIGSIQSE